MTKLEVHGALPLGHEAGARLSLAAIVVAPMRVARVRIDLEDDGAAAPIGVANLTVGLHNLMRRPGEVLVVEPHARGEWCVELVASPPLFAGVGTLVQLEVVRLERSSCPSRVSASIRLEDNT